MRSYAAVSAAPASASSACRQLGDAPGYSCEYNDGLTCPLVSMPPDFLDAEPVQSTPQRDFQLDTFFSPVWMQGPHVFSFAKDGTVVRPELGRLASCSRYQSRVVPCSGDGFDKPWKNVAITEQDDAEFVAMQDAEEMRTWAEAKTKLVGRVYKWPPILQPPCEGCAVLARAQPTVGSSSGVGDSGRSRGAEESVVPALSWSSGKSVTESEVSLVVPCQVRQWVDPHSLIGMDEAERESRWMRSEVAQGVGEEYGNGILSPSIPMAEQWVEDQLTVKLKKILRMPGM